MEKPGYTRRRGETVALEITEHARRRFRQRWALAFPTRPPIEPIDKMVLEWFAKARRIEPHSRKYRTRLRRHGKDTLYFAAPPFVFVVQAASLITVELGSRDTRYLNKKRSGRVEPQGMAAPPDGKGHTANTDAKFPLFKLTARALNESGAVRFVNLGSYDSASVNGCAEKLRNDDAFRREMMRRFGEKRPAWTMQTVYAALGKQGEKVKVLDE